MNASRRPGAEYPHDHMTTEKNIAAETAEKLIFVPLRAKFRSGFARQRAIRSISPLEESALRRYIPKQYAIIGFSPPAAFRAADE